MLMGAEGEIMPRQRIAIVNDDAVYMELMKDLLDEEGYKTTIWDRNDNPYQVIKRERPHLVVRVRVRIDDPEKRLHSGVPAFARLDR